VQACIEAFETAGGPDVKGQVLDMLQEAIENVRYALLICSLWQPRYHLL